MKINWKKLVEKSKWKTSATSPGPPGEHVIMSTDMSGWFFGTRRKRFFLTERYSSEPSDKSFVFYSVRVAVCLLDGKLNEPRLRTPNRLARVRCMSINYYFYYYYSKLVPGPVMSCSLVQQQREVFMCACFSNWWSLPSVAYLRRFPGLDFPPPQNQKKINLRMNWNISYFNIKLC